LKSVLGNLAAAGRVLDETAFQTPGLIRFAAQVAASYLAACGTDRGRRRSFGDVAAAGRSFHKTAYDTPFLIGLAAQFTTFEVAALCTKLDGTLGFGLIFAATEVQRCADKGRCQAD
jgi:hypothetical protein